MSNLTIGKIVNNSATLILNSTDQDGFGEKIVTGNNFSAEIDGESPSGQYTILTQPTLHWTYSPAGGLRQIKLYNDTFHFLKNGPVSGQTNVVTSTNFVPGDLYVIKTQGTTGGEFFDAGANSTPIFDMSEGENNAEPIAGLVFVCLRQPTSATFNGEAIRVGDNSTVTSGDLAIGTTFTCHKNATTALQSSTFPGTATALSTVDYNNCEYSIKIPNESSFPGKTRCLCQVQSIFHKSSNGDAIAYVMIPEMAPQNNFIQGRRVVGALPSSWTSQSTSSLLDGGTMCQNPFGNILNIKILDANTHKILGTDQRHTQYATSSSNNVVQKWATTIMLRLLFLENEDLKDF
jgi:hypothetical protein